MVKIITWVTKFIVVAMAAMLFSSCNKIVHMNSIKGNGKVTTEKREVQGSFKNIKVSNAIDVIIEQSDVTEVTVEADDNLQNSITTKVENGVLIIGANSNSFYNASSKTVHVKMPIIEDLDASSAASITNKNVIKGENISLSTSSAASMKLNLESDNIYCDSSSGSEITISGKALKLETSASSGSAINAPNLLANTVIADASSGATITIHPIISLKAEASSGSNITYNNNPKTIEKQVSSGGNISKD